MGVSVKPEPQFKITCKHISPKVNIESIDKNTLNDLKKHIAKYNLTIELIENYQGEIDEDGYVVDKNDYNAWRKSHPNKISKQSINNIIKSIKNNSLVNWNVDGNAGIGYNYSQVNGSEFEIGLFMIDLLIGIDEKVLKVAKLYIAFCDNVLSIRTTQGDFSTN